MKINTPLTDRDILSLLEKGNFRKKLQNLSKKYKNKKILIYGAGLLSKVIFDNYDLKQFNIIGIADKKYGTQKENFYGYKTFFPDELKELDYDIAFVFLLNSDEKIFEYIYNNKTLKNVRVETISESILPSKASQILKFFTRPYNKILNFINFCIYQTLFNKNTDKHLDWLYECKKTFCKKGNHIVCVGMIKGGSSYFNQLLLELTGYEREWLRPDFCRFRNSKQELNYVSLINCYEKNIVGRGAYEATGKNINLLNKFDIAPVILVRNIFDVVVSIREFLIFRGTGSFEYTFTPKEYFEMNQHDQFDFIIDHSVHGWFDFYNSWYEAVRTHQIKGMFVTYEDIVNNYLPTLQKVCDFYKLNKTDAELNDLWELVNKNRKKETLLNKGVAGRGEQLLTEEQKQRIINLTKYYPNVDFSAMGIPEEMRIYKDPIELIHNS